MLVVYSCILLLLLPLILPQLTPMYCSSSSATLICLHEILLPDHVRSVQIKLKGPAGEIITPSSDAVWLSEALGKAQSDEGL